jgi:hypothetical protein
VRLIEGVVEDAEMTGDLLVGAAQGSELKNDQLTPAYYDKLGKKN